MEHLKEAGRKPEAADSSERRDWDRELAVPQGVVAAWGRRYHVVKDTVPAMRTTQARRVLRMNHGDVLSHAL